MALDGKTRRLRWLILTVALGLCGLAFFVAYRLRSTGDWGLALLVIVLGVLAMAFGVALADEARPSTEKPGRAS